MYKHGKYSNTKDVKPYEVIETIKRYDETYKNYYYFKTEELANKCIEFMKSNNPKPNEYYFGSEYEIKFIGTEKYIKG